MCCVWFEKWKTIELWSVENEFAFVGVVHEWDEWCVMLMGLVTSDENEVEKLGVIGRPNEWAVLTEKHDECVPMMNFGPGNELAAHMRPALAPKWPKIALNEPQRPTKMCPWVALKCLVVLLGIKIGE